MSKPHTLHEIKNKWESVKGKGAELAHNVKEKSAEVVHTIETHPNTRHFWKYIKRNKKEAVLGGIMILGLLFSFHWLGSLVVGLGAGLYAPWGIKTLWNKVVAFSHTEGKFPTFVIAVGAVFMLFHVFAFIIGGLIGLGIKSILIDEFGAGANAEIKTDDRQK